MKVSLCKLLLITIGKWLPLHRHPGGKMSNFLRCCFTKGIVKKIGKNCIIEKGAEIMENCVLGDNTGIGPNSTIGPCTTFKGHSMMGPNVHIYTTGHNYSQELHRFEGVTKPNPVIVGENVWIGYGVTILPGVTIGDHVIVGAGSVVTKDIPSGVVAAGNPCVVKKVLDEDFYNVK